MVYLSDVLQLPVLDSQGQAVGSVCDLIVNMREAFPVVAALVVSPAATARVPIPSRPAPLLIPWRQVVSIEEPRLRLTVQRDQIHAYTERSNDVYLARDILDKQIVDTQGRRVVKVNDLKLAQVRGVARLLGADISFWAFFRRLLPFRFSERLVTWNLVQPVGHDSKDVHLTVPGTSLADLHPADLADLLEDMHPEAGVALLKSLDVETAADALQEVEEAYQAPLVEEMQAEHASDLLEAMPPDEAADIIGDLTEEKAEEILASMAPEPAHEVKELLRYADDTAGGRMTPEVFTLLSHMTAQQAIDKLRAEGPPAATTYYLFVTSMQGELVGVVSLRSLITARPATAIAEIMQRDIISVTVTDDQAEVAAIIRKYNLLGVPVVDEHKRLLGMVTVDAVLDVMHEETAEDISQAVGTVSKDITHTAAPLEAARARIVWLSASLIGGLLAGLILSQFSTTLASTANLMYFIPLIVAMSHVVGAQSLAIADRSDPRDERQEIVKQLGIGLIVGAVCGLAIGVVSFLWVGAIALAAAVGVSLTVTLVFAALVGALSPLILRRLGQETRLAGGPLVNALNSVASVLIYLVLASWLLQLLG
jgi:Mg2+ transporter MgtE